MRNAIYLFLLLFFFNISITEAKPELHFSPTGHVNTQTGFNDSTLVLIPFDYKQSALFHQYTFDVIDSVVNQLLKNNGITLSITGYAHPDEGSDTICKYLSLDRALFVRDYVLGRGVNAERIILVKGMGKIQSKNSDVNKDGHKVNCKVELQLNFPPPPKPPVIADRDEDGIADTDDACPDQFGYKENNGCPDKDAIIIPFDAQQSSLNHSSFAALDSVVSALKENRAYKVSIEGHAYKGEGINTVCENLAKERSDMVKNYLLSRNISDSRIISIKNFGNSRPLNAGRDPQQISLNCRAEIFLTK